MVQNRTNRMENEAGRKFDDSKPLPVSNVPCVAAVPYDHAKAHDPRAMASKL